MDDFGKSARELKHRSNMDRVENREQYCCYPCGYIVILAPLPYRAGVRHSEFSAPSSLLRLKFNVQMPFPHLIYQEIMSPEVRFERHTKKANADKCASSILTLESFRPSQTSRVYLP